MNALTPCARNLPQHFNGCTCVGNSKTAGEVLGVDLDVAAPNVTWCADCGTECVEDPSSPGVLNHLDADGNTDHDADADHTPLDENQLEGMFLAATENAHPLPDIDIDYDFGFTPAEAFEANRRVAVAAADGTNEFEMRMCGIALLSTIDGIDNDRDSIERLRAALDKTGPGEDSVGRFTADDVEELREALRAAVKAGDNNLRTYDGKTAREWREEAAERRRQSAASFERSDTDGALTQWGANVTANKFDAYADLAADGGRSDFPALMDTNGNLVPAKLVNTRYGQSWMLLDDNGKSTGEWVNPSQAATAAKRNAAMAKKGYQVGRVRADAKVGVSDSITAFPYRYRADSGFDPNAEVVATSETED